MSARRVSLTVANAHRRAVAAKRRHIMAADGFNPATSGAVSAWLRNSNAAGSNNIASVADLINTGNPALQSQSARRPSSLADGAMQFTTNDCLVWPLIGNETGAGVINNGTRKWGLVWWAVHDTSGVEETILSIFNLTNGASAAKIEIKRITTGFLRVDAFISATDGRRFTATTNVLTAGVPYMGTVEFDAEASGEDNQLIMTVNANILGSITKTNLGAGTGGNFNAGLNAGVTGNALIGNRRDGTLASPLNGRLALNMWGLAANQNGATQGLLSTTGRTNFLAFEPLAA